MIQRNAIESWTLLSPRPNIILFGDRPGVAEVCEEFSLVHKPHVARNEFGSPLLNDVIAQAKQFSTDGPLCYINADILLTQDFMAAVSVVSSRFSKFLLGGRPWDLAVRSPLSFRDNWSQLLKDKALREGALRNACACDFFVFSNNLWPTVPPFALGRCGFDNALLRMTRLEGAALVDGTFPVGAIHQSHTYPKHLGGDNYFSNPEALRNYELGGGHNKIYGWHHAQYRLQDNRVRFSPTGYLYGNPHLETPVTWLRERARWLIKRRRGASQVPITDHASSANSL